MASSFVWSVLRVVGALPLVAPDGEGSKDTRRAADPRTYFLLQGGRFERKR
jgi:hypothetical protein